MLIKRVVIGIPAYNVESQLGKAIDCISRLMSSMPYQYKVFVLDDASLDHTRQVASEKNAIVFSHASRKGCSESISSLMSECLKLNFDVLVLFKAGEEYNPNDILALLKEVEKGNELVIGSRHKANMLKNPPSSLLFLKAVSFISGLRITDSQSEMRAFTKEVAEKIMIDKGHNYLQEQIIKASRQKFKVKEIAISTIKSEEPNLGCKITHFRCVYGLKEWFNITRILRDYNPLAFFTFFSAFLFLLGFAAALFIIVDLFAHKFNFDFFKTGIIAFILFLAGFQLLIFAFLADMLKK